MENLGSHPVWLILNFPWIWTVSPFAVMLKFPEIRSGPFGIFPIKKMSRVAVPSNVPVKFHVSSALIILKSPMPSLFRSTSSIRLIWVETCVTSAMRNSVGEAEASAIDNRPANTIKDNPTIKADVNPFLFNRFSHPERYPREDSAWLFKVYLGESAIYDLLEQSSITLRMNHKPRKMKRARFLAGLQVYS